MKKNKDILTALILTTLLGSCPLAAGAASPSDFQTPEYYKSGGLDVINAATAYALGYTGKGITLGVS